MIISYSPDKADEHFVRLTNLKMALVDLLGLQIVNNDIDEAHLLEIVRGRIEDRNHPNDRS